MCDMVEIKRDFLAQCADALDARDNEIRRLRDALREIVVCCRTGRVGNAEFVATRALKPEIV